MIFFTSSHIWNCTAKNQWNLKIWIPTQCVVSRHSPGCLGMVYAVKCILLCPWMQTSYAECKDCPLFRGCLSIEVNGKSGRTVGTFRIVHYIMGVHFSGVSVRRGSTVKILIGQNIALQVILWTPNFKYFPDGECPQLCGALVLSRALNNRWPTTDDVPD